MNLAAMQLKWSTGLSSMDAEPARLIKEHSNAMLTSLQASTWQWCAPCKRGKTA